jgi:MFS family permease
MPKTYRSFGAAVRLARRRWNLLTIGGDWALTLTSQVRHNLHWFFYDGVFASASDNIIITYLTFYILALGATSAQIGYLSSLSGIISALMLLPGAFLVERIGHRKDITVFFGGGIARFTLLFVALLPLALTGNKLVWVAILLLLVRDAFSNLSYPAWVSLIGDMIPISGRGRYFGSRNFVMGVAGMSTTLLVGALISRMSQPLGYQLALIFAFAIGMVSTYSFSRLRDPFPETSGKAVKRATSERISLRVYLGEIWQHKSFVMLCVTAILWNFSLNIAGPFFNVYMARELHVGPALIAINSTVSTVASMLAQLFVGRLADRWGPRRLQLITGLMIPILPFAWVFITQAWQIIPVNTLGGALWGIYGLASFNLLLETTPEAQRARYSALYQVIVTMSLAAGAAVGGLILTHFGYLAIFAGSGTGRLIAALLFALLVRPAHVKAKPVLTA